jgi:hypothetical protein
LLTLGNVGISIHLASFGWILGNGRALFRVNLHVGVVVVIFRRMKIMSDLRQKGAIKSWALAMVT